MPVHTAWVRRVWTKVKRVTSRDLGVKMIRNKVFGNCSVRTICMSIIRCLKFSITVCLHFDSRKPKNPNSAILKGVAIFCQKISQVFTLLPFESHSASQFSKVGTRFILDFHLASAIGSQEFYLSKANKKLH